MKKNFTLKLSALILVASIACVFFLNKQNQENPPSEVTTDVTNSQAVHETATSSPAGPSAKQKSAKTQNSASSTSHEEQKSGVFELTAGNFESYVKNCFAGEKCQLGDDPWKMYQDFKVANNRRANDDLIAFMRSQLRDAEFKARYKDILRQMIVDFYPAEERQFQEAAYYNYAGDLQKSLDLYQDLEKKQNQDPSLRPAPKLNIANTLYDMKRFQESLPYYQAALQEYLSGQQQVGAPGQNQMIQFIEERITEVKSRQL